MLFQTGQLVQTSGVANQSSEDPIFAYNIRIILNRYLKGDWGDLCDDDKKLNNNAVESGDDRILAAYNVPNSQAETNKVYIITEWDRSVTTVLFANEY